MKNKTTAWLLAMILWGLGAHKFYLGQTGQGFFYLIFCWTFIPSIIWFLEGISYLSHSEERWNEKYNDWRDSNWKDYYDQLLKFDQLKEKWLIDEKEYEEKVSELKGKIEKSKKKKAEDLEKLKVLEKENERLNKIFKKILIWFWWILLLVILFVIWLTLLWNKAKERDNLQVPTHYEYTWDEELNKLRWEYESALEDFNNQLEQQWDDPIEHKFWNVWAASF